MTVPEFQGWQPATDADRRWHLVDGVPVCMARARENHGRIMAETAFLLTAHLRRTRPGCNVVIAPGVVPPVRSNSNERIPDLGVTCAPPTGARIMAAPLLLVELLSPSNEDVTRANVWAYLTIPSVQEILLLGSLAIEGELMRRGPDGVWPESPTMLTAADELALDCIGFRARLHSLYTTTNLRG